MVNFHTDKGQQLHTYPDGWMIQSQSKQTANKNSSNIKNPIITHISFVIVINAQVERDYTPGLHLCSAFPYLYSNHDTGLHNTKWRQNYNLY